jgi:hypothetical protein
LLSKEGELRGQSLVPADCMFFPMQKELGANPPCKRSIAASAELSRPIGTKPAAPRLNRILNDVEKNVMKSLLGLRRNDVIKAAALVAIVVFPLIAHAQLGRSSGAVKTSKDASPVASAAVRTADVKRDSCADQHWPFLSAGCLRGSTQAVETRLVSMSVEPSANSATTGDASKVVRTADIVRDNEPSVGSKKPAKPRVATHRRERRTPSINYAANLDAGHMPGW